MPHPPASCRSRQFLHQTPVSAMYDPKIDMGNLNLPDQPKFDFRALDNLGVRIANLVTDSRAVTPGDTFLAYRGEKSDGRKFIPQAIAAGANAVLWDRRGFAWDSAWRLPNLPVARLRAKAGIIADHVYGHPS